MEDANKPCEGVHRQWTEDFGPVSKLPIEATKNDVSNWTGKRQSRGSRLGLPSSSFLYLKLHLQKRQLCFGVILILGLSCCVFRRFSGLGAGPVLPRYPFSFVMWPISKNSSSCCGFLRLFICVVLLDIYHKLIFCCCW